MRGDVVFGYAQFIFTAAGGGAGGGILRAVETSRSVFNPTWLFATFHAMSMFEIRKELPLASLTPVQMPL